MRSAVVIVVLAALVFSVESQLLPSDSYPTAYHLKLDLSDFATASSFNGIVQINITVATATSTITLHAQNLTIDVSSVSVMRKAVFASSGWTQESVSNVTNNDTTVTIAFMQPISATEYMVSMNYTGHYQSKMAGFAKIGYYYQKNLRYLGVASLEPAFARLVFPCYDNPSHRTSLLLDITVDKAQMVLTGMKPTMVHNTTESSKMFRFNLNPAMLVSQMGWVVMDQHTFILRNYTTAGGVEIHNRALYPYSNHTEWATSLTSHLVDALASYTGQPYSMAKLEQIVVPEFFTGMAESWGIISYSEETILVTPGTTSTRETQQVALGLAKGVAQQFFGDLISVNSWDNSWLMKGFAEYLKYNICASQPEMSSWELNEQMTLALIQQELAQNTSLHALAAKAFTETDQIQAAYDDLSTYKGGAIIRMLHHFLGDDNFKNALRVIFRSNSESSTMQPKDVWNMMYEAARESGVDLARQSVEGILEEWVNSPGHPVLNVASNGTHFHITQGSGNWYIPVTYTLQSKPDEAMMKWLQPGGTLLVSAPSTQWILVNINQTGFYRVNYNLSIWQLLSNQLRSDLTQIPRLSRAQLIDDVFSLMYSEDLQPDFLLNFTSYLRSETDYYPWHTAIRNYENLLSKLYGHSSYERLQRYLLDLMNGVISKVGLSSQPQDSHIDKLKRALVLEKACAFGHHECLTKASSYLHSWMANTYYDADLSMALLCAGVANSSSTVWHSVWNMYTYSVVPSVRSNIIKALTCSTNSSVLNTFLSEVTSSSEPAVSSKDKTIVLQTLAASPSGAQVLFNWLLRTLYAQMNSSDSESNTTSPVTSSFTESTDISTTPISTPESKTTPRSETTSPEIQSAEGSSLTAKNDTIPEKLSDDDVIAILTYLQRKLTNIDNGNKLEELIAHQEDLGLSPTIVQLMNETAMEVYKNDVMAQQNNGKITAWLLEQAASATTPAGGSSDAPIVPSTPKPSPKPSGASTLYSSLTLCILTVVPHLRHIL